MTELPIGTKIRLINDPGRDGAIVSPPRVRAGKNHYRIQFRDGFSSHPEYEFELVTDFEPDPFTLLERGSFGRGIDLRRQLTHIQLSGRLANLVYSMDTTNIDFYAYQYKPVLSFLESPAKGLLIADEVGLGKTIEAGLIWTELRLRYDARRLLVICPAMLREKWKLELQKRFAVQAEIMDAQQLLAELKVNKGEIPDGKAIVCSTQGLRPPKDKRDELDYDRNATSRGRLAAFLEEQQVDGEPLIDLLIVDEAHHMRNPESQTSRLGRMMRDVSDHIVLLSATPINLRSDDLYYLLNLADPDTFHYKNLFSQVLDANEPLLKAQIAARNMSSTEADIKDHLVKASFTGLLQGNRQLEGLLSEDLSAHLENRFGRAKLATRIEKINLLRHVLTRTRKADVTEWKVVRRARTIDVELTAPEKEFYDRVTEAVRDYAYQADISDGFLLATPQRQMSSCMTAAAESWKKRSQASLAEQLYEDFGFEYEPQAENQIDNDASPLIQHLIDRVLPYVDTKVLREHDSKYHDFLKALSGYLKMHPDEKVIVFSYFRETLKYLSNRLSENEITSEILMGGIKGPKQEVIDRFRDDSSIRVLLASEVACEGVDIQFCRVLFNYDLPWNPTKVDQRIGRIDRLGQTADVISIINFCYEDTIDQRIHKRLLERLNVFERALGGMEAILGEKISELTSALLMNKLSAQEEEERIEQTAMAVENIKREQEELEGQAANLIAHSGFILEKVYAAREFNRRISEQDLFVYVRDYLESYWQGFEFRQIDGKEFLFDIRLPAEMVSQLREFIKNKKLFGQTRLSEGMKIRCKFINKVGSDKMKEESISQFHPLVRYISQDLKNRSLTYCPLIAIKANKSVVGGYPLGIYAYGLHRWSFSGLREDESLQARVVRIGDHEMFDADTSWSFVSLARGEGEDWLSAANEINKIDVAKALDLCAEVLQESFDKAFAEQQNENYDRVSFQVRSAEKHLQRQMEIQKQTLATHRLRNNLKMIPLTEAKIEKIQQRFNVQCAGLKSKVELKGSRFDVSCGLIKIV